MNPQAGSSDDGIEDIDSDWDFPEGDLSAMNLSYEEPVITICGHATTEENADMISVSATSLGKRKEASPLLEHDERSFITGKRARLIDKGHCKLNDPSVPHMIAYCPRVHSLMKAMKLPEGVLFELARLITIGCLQYKDITKDKLEILSMQGNNDTAVPLISQVFQRDRSGLSLMPSAADKYFADELAATYPWKELDREEAALSRGPYEGLGNNPNEPGWYGGKVEFRGRLKSLGKESLGKEKPYEIVLDSCALGPSSRFSRRFGSSSFIRIKIPLNMFHDSNNNLTLFFKKPFIIWGKVFRACYAKEDNIFLYRTNESYPFGSSTIPGRLSFEEFIEWQNPIQHNSRQLMTKWSTRTTLGFSNSVPGPRIRQNLVREIDDIISETGSEMTDGCGLVTKSVTRALLEQFSLSYMPTAFQFRLGGCKGMLAFSNDEHPELQDYEHAAWVRPSQTKIRYSPGVLDPAMLTFDTIRTSRLSSPSKISSEIIINLADNGVPRSVFANLLKTSIRDMFEALTTWQGPDAMFNLWMNIERFGGVLTSRRVREAVGEARARGYTNRSPEDADLDDNADEDAMDDLNFGSAPRSVAWWADQISGCPSSLEETVMVLLDSGFLPQECPILREKLRKVVSYKVESKTQNLRFELKQSCCAFAIPDPYNVLGPNEVQIKSSRRNLLGEDGLLTDIITGDVLIARNPCKLPSDIRKVKAVDHPLLRNYLDVIVFSVQGHRRLIDFLAGGDYDGDVVLALWAAIMVSSFNNADEKYSVDPVGLDLAFARDTETGSAFLERIKGAEPEARIHAMQTYLLGALVDPSLIGKYSAMHTNAIYQLGLGHPRTHKLAAKFARVLDSSKNGYRIKPETILADTKQYFHPRGPQWQAASKEKKKKSSKPRFSTVNGAYLQRDYTSPYVKGTFIMDHLREVATKERERLLIEVDQIFAPLLNEPDPALIAPWEAAVKWANMPTNNKESAKSKQKTLGKIAIHVQTMFRRNKGIFARAREQSNAADASNKSGPEFTHLSIEVRQDELRALSKAFWSEPLLEDVPDIPDQETLDRWRASYAYKYDAEQNLKNGEQGFSRFPWNVALRELCAIKARSIGPYKVVSNSFYERFKLVNR